MTGENRLPDRYKQNELFLADLGDALLKSDMAGLEHPIFSIAKNPDTTVRRYEQGDNWLEITPSVKGRATIYDKDVLIFAISQLMAAKKRGREIIDKDRTVRFTASDYLVFTNKSKSGRAVERLAASLGRLAGTRLETNVRTNGIDQRTGLGLIESYQIIHDSKGRRVIAWEITLSEWLFRAVQANEVLTLHRDYFRLKSSLERRVYEIARKHCGHQLNWKIGLGKLQEKTGSTQVKRNFRQAINQIADADSLPEYAIWLDNDMVHVQNRAEIARLEAAAVETSAIKLEPDTYNDARQLAPGFDVYALEQQWRDWMSMGGMDAPTSPDRAFLGFCRKWVERNG